MYHMVADRLPYKVYSDHQKVKNFLRVEPAVFEQQVCWLKENGFSFFMMRDVLRDDLPERSVFLTFDDGFADNFKNAFPILQKHQACATVYLVNNRFKKDWSTDRMTGVASAELNDQEMLSHDQIRLMLDSGLVEIGGHTLDHCRLTELSDSQALEQLAVSKQEIERLYDTSCISFAYPFGFYNDRIIPLVERAGYENACTTEYGTDEDRYARRYMLKRIMVSGNDQMTKFVHKICYGRDV